MAFALKIATDTGAFEDVGTGSELARILRELASWIDGEYWSSDYDNGTLRDINGQHVGSWILDTREKMGGK